MVFNIFSNKNIVDCFSGEVKLVTDTEVLQAVGLGSCIAIIAIDCVSRVAGIAHVMYSGPVAQHRKHPRQRYIDHGWRSLLMKMLDKGAAVTNITVCLVGAGNVLKRKDDTVCPANIAASENIFRKFNVMRGPAVLGGLSRKAVWLDGETLQVYYAVGAGKKILLWQCQPSQNN